MSTTSDVITRERIRVQAEYQRRRCEIAPDLYQPWRPEVALELAQRRRLAARMLRDAGLFPGHGDACCEVGYGTLGWLPDLISWGVRETDLHGLELDPERAQRAQELLPLADLRVGDATKLPFQSNRFRLVIASTLFTSILDDTVRQVVAAEITRVLSPGSALLWYDFAVSNPRNPHVRRVTREELTRLFPDLQGSVKKVTLAPPLARILAPRCWTLALLLEVIPLLRTHLLAVLRKAS